MRVSRSRRLLAVAVAVISLAGAGAFLSRDNAPPPPPPAEPVAAPVVQKPRPPVIQAAPVPDATLAGVVVLSDGQPAAGAQVRLEPRGVVATANSEGRFSFTPVQPGVYTALATLGQLVSDRASGIVIAPGAQVRDLRLALAPGATLTGTVRDAADNHTVESCSAAVAGREIACDHAGRFTLGALSPGEWPLRVTSPGYAPRELSITIARRAKQSTEVLLSRGATVLGRVVDPDHKPFPGATVATAHYALNGVLPAEVSGQSGADGKFELTGVAGGRVSIRASAPGYAEAATELFVQGGDQREGVELVLTTGGAIAGTVSDASGQATVGARVEAIRLTDRASAGTDQSAVDGSFRFDGLEPGDYSLVAETAHARGVVSSVRVSPREEAAANIILGDDTIDGVVVDAHQQPIANAVVTAYSSFGGGRGGQTAATDANGKFALTGLVGSPFRVEARAKQGVTEVRGVTSGAHITLVLAATGNIEGSVADAAGHQVEDLEVTIVPHDPAVVGTVAGRYRVLRVLAPDGAFRANDLPVGRYEVHGTAGGSRDSDSQEAIVEANQTTTVRLSLKGSAKPPPKPRPDKAALDFAGISASVGSRNGQPIIQHAFEGGPAFLSGVQDGDEIVAVNGWSTVGASLTAIVDRIRGPVGTPVILDLRRPSTGVTFQAFPERMRVVVDSF